MIREGPRICLSLCDGLHGLIVVSAHCDLSYVYITIAHGDACQILLLGLFTAGSELCNCAGRSSLGSLSAGIGINPRY